MPPALPQSNATLRRIREQGFSPDGELPATEGTVKWEGATAAYVTEETMRSAAAGRLDVLVGTSIVIPGDLRPPVAIKAGDVVVYDYAGVQHSRTVRNHRAAVMPGVLSTVKIHFEES